MLRHAAILPSLLVLTLLPAWTQGADQYEPTWESLAQHEAAPEWFQDAKFGIYFPWGVYSVPAFGSEWYPRHMHFKDRREYKHHVETYGEPTEFGYDVFVPMFKAEHFDAARWADLFVKAGARFAGPVAEHHDGFAMWASKVTPWNAGERGPKRDITGELAKAIRERGLKFITTFHHARNNLFQRDGKWDGHYLGVKQNFPSVLEDPERAFLYGYMPREQFLQMWLAKLVEVINNYRPDIIWFDSWLDQIPEQLRQKFLAYYYNRAAEWDQEVVVTFKQQDFPRSVAVEDFEKGRADHLTDYVWLTDDTISKGSWCYTKDLKIKSANEVIDTLIDIVSKNGVLLLNISPKADGTIPDDQKQVLLDIGQWLSVNGEAIYETRPWFTYGEGPTGMERGGHFVGSTEYTDDDIRYTRSKDGQALYAIALGWPGRLLTLNSVKVDQVDDDATVHLLGWEEPLGYGINESGRPVIVLPTLTADQLPCEHAFAIKLEGFSTALHPDVESAGEDAITLEAEFATREGDALIVESKQAGRKNIGRWDHASDKLHWLVHISSPGTYQVRGEFASISPSAVRLSVAGQTREFKVPSTGGWAKSQLIKIGAVTFDQPGVYHVILEPADSTTWKPINVWKLQLAASE